MTIDTIIHGDCLKVMEHMEEQSVDVVFTSPPYNRIRNDTYEHYDDDREGEDYYNLLKDFTDLSLKVAKSKVIVNIQQNHFNKKEVFRYIGEYSEKISGVIIWTKSNPQPAKNYHKEDNTRSITNSFEYFFVLTKDGEEFRAYGNENTLNLYSNER